MHKLCDKDIDSCTNWGAGPPRSSTWGKIRVVKIGVWALLESPKEEKVGKWSNLKQYVPLKSKAIKAF